MSSSLRRLPWLLLALLVVFWARGKKDVGVAYFTEELRPYVFDPAQIQFFQVQEKDFAFACRKVDKQWRLLDAKAAPLKSDLIESILLDMANLPKRNLISLENVLSAGDSLARYGLDEPLLKLVLGDGFSKRSYSLGQGSLFDEELYLKESTARLHIGCARAHLWKVSRKVRRKFVSAAFLTL